MFFGFKQNFYALEKHHETFTRLNDVSLYFQFSTRWQHERDRAAETINFNQKAKEKFNRWKYFAQKFSLGSFICQLLIAIAHHSSKLQDIKTM